MDELSIKNSTSIQRSNQLSYKAALDYYGSNPPKLIRKVVIALDTALGEGNPLEINFPFNSVYVKDATDSAVSVSLKFFENSLGADTFDLSKDDALSFDFPVTKAFITFAAQTGKSITLMFIIQGRFFPGTQLVEVASSVDGNSFSSKAVVSVLVTATAIFAADNTRKAATLYNNGPDIIYLGDSSVTILTGIPLLVGEKVTIKNTAALYGIVQTTTSTIRNLTES